MRLFPTLTFQTPSDDLPKTDPRLRSVYYLAGALLATSTIVLVSSISARKAQALPFSHNTASIPTANTAVVKVVPTVAKVTIVFQPVITIPGLLLPTSTVFIPTTNAPVVTGPVAVPTTALGPAPATAVPGNPGTVVPATAVPGNPGTVVPGTAIPAATLVYPTIGQMPQATVPPATVKPSPSSIAPVVNNRPAATISVKKVAVKKVIPRARATKKVATKK